MWGFHSKATCGTSGLNNHCATPNEASSDDDNSVNESREEGLECPICCESFNIVENVPHVLWCGHTLCKNCVLALQWAVVKLPTLPVQLPFFISCPWCNLLSLRLVYKGNLKFPQKNYFLLWMVESLNGDRLKPLSSSSDNLTVGPTIHPSNHHHHHRRHHDHDHGVTTYMNSEMLHASIRKSLIFFLSLTVKFPLVFILVLIIVYAIPASIAVLVLYILVTIAFAIPSFLVLYFAYPSLDWLVKEIVA